MCKNLLITIFIFVTTLTFINNKSSGDSSISLDGIENKPTPTHIGSLNFSGIEKGTAKILDVNITSL